MLNMSGANNSLSQKENKLLLNISRSKIDMLATV